MIEYSAVVVDFIFIPAKCVKKKKLQIKCSINVRSLHRKRKDTYSDDGV